jgi:hypothetical protein
MDHTRLQILAELRKGTRCVTGMEVIRKTKEQIDREKAGGGKEGVAVRG